MTLYSNVGLISKGAEDVVSQNPENNRRFRLPHCRLSPPLHSPGNLREYPHKPYIARIHSHWAISSLVVAWVYLYSNFRGRLLWRMCFETECVLALQGHPRSLILAPIDSAYATSYWSSIVTLVLSCPVSEILQIFCWDERPHPYSTRILGFWE